MVKRDSKRVKILKEKARRRSVGEGIFWSARNSFGDYYVAPFAIAINTSNSLVALLTSIAGILGPLTQIFSSKLMEKYSRKEILLKVLFYESLMWIPLIAIAILFYKGIFLGALPLTLLISFSFYVIIRSVSVPSGFSWFGDLVDGKHRGRWFSKRNLLMGFVAVSLAIIAAFFLDYFTKRGWLMFGFMILFFLAFASRISSRRMFKKM